jgi:hypothetical protein
MGQQAYLHALVHDVQRDKCDLRVWVLDSGFDEFYQIWESAVGLICNEDTGAHIRYFITWYT